MNVWLNKTITIFFLSTIAFTALAHGAVEAWSLALGSAALVVVFLLWLLHICWKNNEAIYVPSLVWPCLGFIALSLVQSVVWTDSAGHRASLSLDVEATRNAAVWWSLLLLTLVMVANFFASRERLKMLTTFCVWFGLLLSLFALLQQATWAGKFYWWRSVNTQQITMPFGPFVHHGHYAGYLELLLPIPIAFLILHSTRLETKLLYGFAAAIMGASIVVSLARGGILSLVAQMMFLAMAGRAITRRRNLGWEGNARSTQPRRFRAGAVMVIVIAIAIGVVWLGLEPVLNRLATPVQSGSVQIAETFLQSRGWIWRDTWAIFRAHSLMGVGIGAFETAFPLYSQSDGSLTVSAAHNDYLQLLAEGGVIAGVFALWLLVAWGHALGQALRSPDSFAQAVALSSGAATLGMLVHSLFDFNLQLPSHALLFLTFVGVLAQLGARVAVQESALLVASPLSTNYFDLTDSLSERELS